MLSPARIYDAFAHRGMMRSAENILAKTSYNIAVFGHSHAAMYRNFGVHGEYFNTGTWTQVINFDIDKFGRNVDLTYVLIEYVDDRPRAGLKRWVGMHRIFEDILA